MTGLGCVLAVFGTRLDDGGGGRGLGLGPVFAFGTCLLYAVYTIGLARAIESIGWAQAVLTSRAFSVGVALVVILWALRRGRRSVSADQESFPIEVDSGPAVGLRLGFRDRLGGRIPRGRSVLLIGAIGSLAAIGQMTRGFALQTTPAWLIGLVAATSPVIVLGVALMVLRERMTRTQWIGVVMVMAGVVLVAAA
jgi:drug/metabolite transporter (DMT)-like permease